MAYSLTHPHAFAHTHAHVQHNTHTLDAKVSNQGLAFGANHIENVVCEIDDCFRYGCHLKNHIVYVWIEGVPIDGRSERERECAERMSRERMRRERMSRERMSREHARRPNNEERGRMHQVHVSTQE
jgi:hypothetical protein